MAGKSPQLNLKGEELNHCALIAQAEDREDRGGGRTYAERGLSQGLSFERPLVQGIHFRIMTCVVAEVVGWQPVQ
jgi:hypothetical protein